MTVAGRPSVKKTADKAAERAARRRRLTRKLQAQARMRTSERTGTRGTPSMAPPGFPAFSHAPALTLAPAAKFLVKVTQCPYHVAVDRAHRYAEPSRYLGIAKFLDPAE